MENKVRVEFFERVTHADASHSRKASAFFRWQLIICAKCPEEYI